jgi:hypothetical protein
MNSQRLWILAAVVVFFASTHRLPAPIQEITETPTPARKLKQRSDDVKKSETKRSTPVPKSRAPLAGTWVGTVHTFPTGDQTATLVINPTETAFTVYWYGKTATVATQRVGTSTLTATFSQTSQPQAQVWTITPQPDGTTALVHFTAFLNDSNTVFRQTSGEASATKK